MCTLRKALHLLNLKLSGELDGDYWDGHFVDIPSLSAGV